MADVSPSTNTPITLKEAVSKSRGWFIFGGILSIFVGLAAIAQPYFFTIAVTQLIGAFCIISGVFSLSHLFCGEHKGHRVVYALSGIIRLFTGLALLFFVISGAEALTLVLAVFFLLEGIMCIGTALQMRQNPGWPVLLLNGLVALILGGMVYARWPANSDWVIGVLYGINSLFAGVSLLTLALAAPKSPSDSAS